MAHSVAHRLLTALLALWFGVAAADLPAVHPCPMHGMAGMAHAGGMAHQTGDHHPDPSSHAQSHCTCPADCGGAGSALAPAPAGTVTAAAEVAVARIAPPPAVDVVADQYRLPFPTAPPQA